MFRPAVAIIRFKNNMFRPAVSIIRFFLLKNTFKIVLYNSRDSVLSRELYSTILNVFLSRKNLMMATAGRNM